MSPFSKYHLTETQCYVQLFLIQRMKKTIEITGVNGTFKGLVEVKLNYRSEPKQTTHAVTHDDITVIEKYHMVAGYAEGETFQSKDFMNENLVWQHIDEIEKKVNYKLRCLANDQKHESIQEQLAKKGYL